MGSESESVVEQEAGIRGAFRSPVWPFPCLLRRIVERHVAAPLFFAGIEIRMPAFR